MNPEHKAILAAKTERLRQASGTVTDTDPLVCFLYLLARNEVPVGASESLLGEVEISSAGGDCVYTNGWVARWAQDAARRLRTCTE